MNCSFKNSSFYYQLWIHGTSVYVPVGHNYYRSRVIANKARQQTRAG